MWESGVLRDAAGDLCLLWRKSAGVCRLGAKPVADHLRRLDVHVAKVAVQALASNAVAAAPRTANDPTVGRNPNTLLELGEVLDDEHPLLHGL